MTESAGNRLSLPSINPLGPLSYAWRIADQALNNGAKRRGLKHGMMGEPIGAGVSPPCFPDGKGADGGSRNGILRDWVYRWRISLPVSHFLRSGRLVAQYLHIYRDL